MTDTTLGTRDERGNWGPTYLREMPAPMVWPRLVGALKWLFGWPGYLWPWNSLSGWAWPWWPGFFLTPALAAMQTFELWWIALIFGRNVGLVLLYFGSLHLYFYFLNGQIRHGLQVLDAWVGDQKQGVSVRQPGSREHVLVPGQRRDDLVGLRGGDLVGLC